MYFIFLLLKVFSSDLEKELKFCNLREISKHGLENACREFWSSAKKIDIFNKIINSEVKKNGWNSDKPIYEFWSDFIISLSTGNDRVYKGDLSGLYKFTNVNAHQFYGAMYNISHFIDFSNHINGPYILTLVDDLAQSLNYQSSIIT
ncbi:uncharacterized protein VNE69_02228 [Vairimorpha necatrix]|uniref:Uncharacterized protein n=1 Tax=Vairimorpha necatrix TaxID=6039 RepID=A0AAX4J9P5_9MICR